MWNLSYGRLSYFCLLLLWHGSVEANCSIYNSNEKKEKVILDDVKIHLKEIL